MTQQNGNPMDYIRDHGYVTALCGTQHVSEDTCGDLGYDIVTTREQGETVEEQTETVLKQWKDQLPGKSFFLVYTWHILR